MVEITARMRGMRTLFLTFCILLSLVLPIGAAAAGETDPWRVLTSGVDTNLRGISADYAVRVTDEMKRSPDIGTVVIWVCGSNGVILRSRDSGASWKQVHVEGGEKSDFRAIRSFGTLTAYVMSVGEKGSSRIYKTTDGGESWRLQYSDSRPEFFLDGLVCRTEKDCFAISDPIDGKFVLLHTEDGEHWKELPKEAMPAALPKEGIFAASNSALVLWGKNELLFGTGGPAARVFQSSDAGRSWSVTETPILSGNASSGIFSLRCSGDTVVAVGGDYAKTAQPTRTAAYSLDRGVTWKIAEQAPGGFRSGVEIINGKTWLAVGPTGADVSTDQGAHWKPSGSPNLNAVFVLNGGTVLAVGAKGTVAKYRAPQE
jgi:photosystem II stability/assembly factor-like uncharacterized protein